MQPRAAVEELHEQLRLRAVFIHVLRPEKIFRVTREERGEIARGRVMADQDLGHAFAEVFAAAVDGAGRGCDPVLGQVGVGRLGRPRESIESAAARIGAPHAIGREADEFLAVGEHA